MKAGVLGRRAPPRHRSAAGVANGPPVGLVVDAERHERHVASRLATQVDRERWISASTPIQCFADLHQLAEELQKPIRYMQRRIRGAHKIAALPHDRSGQLVLQLRDSPTGAKYA